MPQHQKQSATLSHLSKSNRASNKGTCSTFHSPSPLRQTRVLEQMENEIDRLTPNCVVGGSMFLSSMLRTSYRWAKRNTGIKASGSSPLSWTFWCSLRKERAPHVKVFHDEGNPTVTLLKGKSWYSLVLTYFCFWWHSTVTTATSLSRVMFVDKQAHYYTNANATGMVAVGLVDFWLL